MANEQERKTGNFLEREARAKKEERRKKYESKQKAKVDKDEVLKEFMKKVEHHSGQELPNQEIGKGEFVPLTLEEIHKKLKVLITRTDDALEAQFKAEEKLKRAEKHYKRNDSNGLVEKLTEEVIRLQKEANAAKKAEKNMTRFVEGFEKNGPQIVKIYNLEQRTIAKKQRSLRDAKNALSGKDGINEKLKIIKNNENEIKKIREQQAKVDKELENLAKKVGKTWTGGEMTEEQKQERAADFARSKVLAEQKIAIEKQLKEKQNDKSVLEAISEKSRLEEKAKALKETIKMYESGKSKEDQVIHKCRLAREMLLAGKSWDEINIASIKEIKERQGKIKKSDRQGTKPEPKPEPEHHGPRLEPKPEPEHHEPKPEPKPEPLPPVPARFEERHPKLSKIPFLARFANGFAEGRRKAMAKRGRNKNDDIDWIKEPSEDEPAPIEPEKPQSPIKEPIKDKRDRFMEYLREAVEEGHTEQGKYVTQEGLKDKEMRDRIDVRTQKEAERRTNGGDKTENKGQQVTEHEGMQLGD